MRYLPLALLLTLASCDRDLAQREKLLPPEVKLGATREQILPALLNAYGDSSEPYDVTMPEGRARMLLGFSNDKLSAVTIKYITNERRVGDSSRAVFKRVSTRATDHLGMPDDWIQRDTLAGQRMVWYYEADSTVISLWQRPSGAVDLEMNRSGEAMINAMWEMNNFLTAPQ